MKRSQEWVIRTGTVVLGVWALSSTVTEASSGAGLPPPPPPPSGAIKTLGRADVEEGQERSTVIENSYKPLALIDENHSIESGLLGQKADDAAEFKSETQEKEQQPNDGPIVSLGTGLKGSAEPFESIKAPVVPRDSALSASQEETTDADTAPTALSGDSLKRDENTDSKTTSEQSDIPVTSEISSSTAALHNLIRHSLDEKERPSESQTTKTDPSPEGNFKVTGTLPAVGSDSIPTVASQTEPETADATGGSQEATQRPHFERFNEWDQRVSQQQSLSRQRPDPPGRSSQAEDWQQQTQQRQTYQPVNPVSQTPLGERQGSTLPPQGTIPGLATPAQRIQPPPTHQNQPIPAARPNQEDNRAQFHGFQQSQPASISNQQFPIPQQQWSHPQGQRPVHQQRVHRSQPKPVWRRLWTRIEGTLDNLADLEDKVAGRASQIYATTVETASSAMKSRKPPGQPLPANGRPELGARKMPPKPQVPSNVAQSNIQKTPTIPTNPYLALAQKKAQQQATQQGQQATRNVTRINWNDAMSGKTARPILANGGASSAPGDGSKLSSPGASFAGRPNNPASGMQYRQPQQRPPTYPQTQGSTVQRQGASPILQNTPRRNPAAANTATTTGARPPQQPRRPLPLTASASDPPPRRPTRPSYRDDDDEDEGKFKLGRFLPPLPKLRIPWFRQNSMKDYSATMDAWSAEDSDDDKPRGLFGLWRKKHTSDSDPIRRDTRSKPADGPVLTKTVRSLMDRCGKGSSYTLLKDEEKRKCVGLGQKKAVFDLLTVFFVLYATRDLLRVDFGQFSGDLFGAAAVVFSEVKEGWVLEAAGAALLSWLTSTRVYERAASSLATSIGNSALYEAQYGSLFLRLVSSKSTPDAAVESVKSTSEAQALAAVDSSRLTTFTAMLLLSLVAITLSFIQPLLLAAGDSLVSIFTLSEWRSWPPEWTPLWGHIQQIGVQFFRFVKSAASLEIQSLSQQPLRFAYDASLFFSLLLVAQLPKLVMLRKVQGQLPENDEDDEDNSIESNLKSAQTISDLGGSSATRLQLLSKKSALDDMLEMWRNSRPRNVVKEGNTTPIKDLLSFVFYGVLGGLLLVVPLFVYAHAGVIGDPTGSSFHPVHWDSLWEVAVILVSTQTIFLAAVRRALEASSAKKQTVQFIRDFVVSVHDRTKQLRSPPANLQVQASISSSTGLAIHDLWSAHSARRAWAVRGANFVCQNGEVLVVLGDDGAGKSRLLTTLAENILGPAKQAQTSTKVRGAISIGGVDVSKWDPNQLRKRVGLLLNDVRTSADLSQLFSGLTIEEILDPNDGLRHLDSPTNIGSGSRASMILALKLVGLYSTLLPRLPSKLSTVVTGNEDDLTPSPLRPRSYILSPIEWTKLILARIICYAIYNNDHSASTNDQVEKSLMGCLLLLDDVTASLSEIDEGRFLKHLRSSGAAAVLASNRWSIGRWADRIVVLRDGAILESGTHDELLSRGPQQSLYASRWHEMTKT